MNAIAQTLTARLSPLVAAAPADRPHRRRRVHCYQPSDTALDRFNGLITRLDPATSALEYDALATAARRVCEPSEAGAAALRAIHQRLRRAVVLTRLLADAGWTPANDAYDIAIEVVDYVRGDHDLIPDALRQVGRLDDAIVVDAAWPRLSDEVAEYLDYCRLRRVEAALRGAATGGFHFDRGDWQDAARAEAALAAHCRAVRDGCYVRSSAPLFRVH
ncbi:hypothetical protein [Lysobacter sp. A3-1-A15]|uniref:hypothetical protein n=1 Tax=Novilysobacter viscosus TaxID=3098602 RepID=UPI003983C487